jgi:biotin-[acetyl-CoA-carboxylase] ligase BirA-like protein
MNANNNANLDSNIFYFDEVSSTMDKAKEILRDRANNNKDIFGIITGNQNNGRGTNGRVWKSGFNNLYMTAVFPLSKVPVPMTLIPLRIGTLIAPTIQSLLDSDASNLVQLKWPNDLLIDNKKVGGVLIEIENNNVLVGIGCNIGSAPTVETNGKNGGRKSTCLYDYKLRQYNENNETNVKNVRNMIANSIMNNIMNWIEEGNDSSSLVINEFQSLMTTSPQVIRKELNKDDNTGSIIGQSVIPLRLNSDGTLQVKLVENNKELSLITDYLF